MNGQDLGQDSLLAIVLDDGITKLHFYFLVDLIPHALQDIFPVEAIAFHRALYPQRQRGINANDKIQVSGGSGLKNQGRFADRVRSATGLRLHPSFAIANDGGMNEGVQDFQFGRIGKDLRGHPGPVD